MFFFFLLLFSTIIWKRGDAGLHFPGKEWQMCFGSLDRWIDGMLITPPVLSPACCMWQKSDQVAMSAPPPPNWACLYMLWLLGCEFILQRCDFLLMPCVKSSLTAWPCVLRSHAETAADASHLATPQGVLSAANN